MWCLANQLYKIHLKWRKDEVRRMACKSRGKSGTRAGKRQCRKAEMWPMFQEEDLASPKFMEMFLLDSMEPTFPPFSWWCHVFNLEQDAFLPLSTTCSE